MAAAVIPIATTEARANAPRTLYEIVDHLSALLNSAALVEDPELRKQLDAEIAATMEAEVLKVDNTARYLNFCESQVQFAVREIKRLEARKADWQLKQQNVEEYVVRTMQAINLSSLEGQVHTLKLRKNPPSVLIVDEALVPEEFKTVSVEEKVNKTAVKAALQNKQDVPGCRLITDKQRVERQ